MVQLGVEPENLVTESDIFAPPIKNKKQMTTDEQNPNRENQIMI